MKKQDFLDLINGKLKMNRIAVEVQNRNVQLFLMDKPKCKEIGTVRVGVAKYTLANAKDILTEISALKDVIEGWKTAQRNYQKTAPYRLELKKIEMLKLALNAGLHHDEHGGYHPGDYFNLTVVDFIYKKKDLEAAHASGPLLGIIKQRRKRIYAKSSKWNPSYREDFFLVGTNENGTAFCHQVQVPPDNQNVFSALEWIWGGKMIEKRQGDIGICASPYKNVIPEKIDSFQIRDNHYFTGEGKVNGGLHVNAGIIYHLKEQHPAIVLKGTRWYRVIIGRRSTIGLSSRD